MSNIPKWNLASGCHLFKKIDQPSWRTTRLNYKHIPQIVCISSRFRVLHLLSWEFERSEVLWRYTVILVCRLKHVQINVFPLLPDNQNDRNCTEMNNLLVCSHSPPRRNWMNQSVDEWCHYMWYKCQFVMLYLAWDREINISLFFCDVFVWKWGPETFSH